MTAAPGWKRIMPGHYRFQSERPFLTVDYDCSRKGMFCIYFNDGRSDGADMVYLPSTDELDMRAFDPTLVAHRELLTSSPGLLDEHKDMLHRIIDKVAALKRDSSLEGAL